jgi:hypothetical protein
MGDAGVGFDAASLEMITERGAILAPIRGPNLNRRMASFRDSMDALEASERVASELTSETGARRGIIQEKKARRLSTLLRDAIQENDR